jgi:hypothetical protein
VQGGSSRRIKEKLSKSTMTGDRFIETFLNGLSLDGLKHGNKDRRAEFRRGYPRASEAEIQMLLDAGSKAEVVPHNLDHARLILSDNVFPLPSVTKQASKRWPVPDKRLYSSVGSLIIARAMQRFAAENPDLAPALMADAITLEKRALDAIAAGVSEILIADATPKPEQKTDREQWRERTQSTMAKLASMTFADWDHRPAVLLDGKAFAVLRPGGPWVEVDAFDVGHTAGVMSRLAWRERFGWFGRLDLTKIPGSPLRPPTPQDFDDAVLAIQALRRENNAKAGLPELPEVGEAGGMRFVDWDHRPAVLVGNKAFAMLRPGTAWVSVDRDDVYHTGAEQSESAWRKRFVGNFGSLPMPPRKPAKPGTSSAAALARTLQIVAEVLAASANAPDRERAPPLAPL